MKVVRRDSKELLGVKYVQMEIVRKRKKIERGGEMLE